MIGSSALGAVAAALLVANGVYPSDPLAPPPESAPTAEMAPPAAAAPPVVVPGSERPAAPGPRPEAGAVPMQPFAPSRPMKTSALRVAVIDPQATGEIPARPLAAFGQSLVPEIRKLEGVSAVGMAEIRDMLGFEMQRQMMGCTANDECLAEIAGSLGVDEIVSSELTLVGKTYTLALRRLDMRKAAVIQGDSRKFDQRDGEELLSIVGPSVEALFPDRALREGKTRGVQKSVIRRLNPPPLPRWIFIATASGAVAAAAGGGAFHYLAADAEKEFDRLVDRSHTEPVSASELARVTDRVRARETTRNVFLFTALGLGVASGVEAFFTDWRNDRAAILPLALADGGGLMVAGRY